MNTAVVGVGSNIEPEENVEKARVILEEEGLLAASSSFVKTKPIGFMDQPDFLNGAFLIKTEMGKEELAAHLRAVEDKLGRVRTENKFGPRTIDLDIVVWNRQVVDEDYRSRRFLKDAVDELVSIGD